MSILKNILFRADSSSIMGTGHIMRDLVLASQYKDSNIIFATRDLDGNINNKIIEAGYKIEILNSNNINELNEMINRHHIELLVIDHYDISYQDEKQLKTQNPTLKILSFDDTYEKHYCDILLNHNISADEKKYEELVPKRCEVRCGSKYTLLRDEFLKEKNLKREKIYDFFVAMGGADTANLNIEILKTLPKDKKVVLVTTNANKNLESLQEYVKDKENISLFVNSKKIAKLINQSRVAIVTPSVIVNEVYFLNVPFIAIKTADNQRDIYEYLSQNNFKVLEKFDKQKLDDMLIKISLVNFIDLTLNEKKMILEWRNHINIRKWMRNSEKISLEDHLAYIDSLSNKEDKIYFLVIEGIFPIGVIDFTNIDKKTKSAEIGLYRNPIIEGAGKTLMKSIQDYAKNNLKITNIALEVKQNNIKAISLYKKNNFKEIDIKNDKLIMELHI